MVSGLSPVRMTEAGCFVDVDHQLSQPHGPLPPKRATRRPPRSSRLDICRQLSPHEAVPTGRRPRHSPSMSRTATERMFDTTTRRAWDGSSLGQLRSLMPEACTPSANIHPRAPAAGHSTSMVAPPWWWRAVPEQACDRWGIAPFTQAAGRGFETRFSPHPGLTRRRAEPSRCVCTALSALRRRVPRGQPGSSARSDWNVARGGGDMSEKGRSGSRSRRRAGARALPLG